VKAIPKLYLGSYYMDLTTNVVLAAIIAFGFYLVNRHDAVRRQALSQGGGQAGQASDWISRLHRSAAMVFLGALSVLCALHYMMPDEAPSNSGRGSDSGRGSGSGRGNGRGSGSARKVVGGGGYVFD
jgi:hypothetical protein